MDTTEKPPIAVNRMGAAIKEHHKYQMLHQNHTWTHKTKTRTIMSRLVKSIPYIVVKFGTITEDYTTADCYSYARDEDCPVLIPNLRELLENRGIRIAGMQKTVKSMAELQVELKATYRIDY